MSVGILFAVICASLAHQLLALDTVVTVKSKAGTFNGYVRTFQGYDEKIQSDRFLGIPYAEPPVGDRRFKKPEKKAILENQYDASKRKPGCLQLKVDLGGKRKQGVDIENSVDCLYMNIYRPHGTKSDSRLPVIFVIHGGAFVVGESDIYPGDLLSVYGDVLVVVINYRLNIWGFLSTGDENLPGNLGLWDQHLAIQWVHDNIESFGGDPDVVTILGLSAGSTSVIYQGMFPDNKGLFKRIVAQSGTFTTQWGYQADPLSVAKRLGSLVGCDLFTTTRNLAACLNERSDEELDAAQNGPNKTFLEFASLGPVVDGDFVPVHPDDILHGSCKECVERRKNLADFDLLTGLTDGEGLLHVCKFTGVDDPETFTLTREQFEQEVIPGIVESVFGKGAPDILNDLIIAEYTNWADPNNATLIRESFVRLAGDFNFNIQVIDVADIHNTLSGKDTYFYFVAANPSQHIITSVSWSDKTNHADDWVFLFGYDDQDDGMTTWTEPYGQQPEPWELELSKALIRMFANFARSGDPNKPKSTAYGTTSIPWPKYDVVQRQYVTIRQNGMSVGRNLFARPLHFWYHLLPRVVTGLTSQNYAGDRYCDKEGC